MNDYDAALEKIEIAKAIAIYLAIGFAFVILALIFR